MPLSQDDKDEIRLLIAKEIKDAVTGAFNAVTNAAISSTDISYATSPEGMREREARNKIRAGDFANP